MKSIFKRGQVHRKPLSKKFRKGDRIVVISGNNKGLSGVIKSINADKVIVQGLNLGKKHLKKSQEAPRGRIIDIERPIHVSNLKLYVEGDIATKLKVSVNEEGNRQYVYKQGDQEVVYRTVK